MKFTLDKNYLTKIFSVHPDNLNKELEKLESCLQKYEYDLRQALCTCENIRESLSDCYNKIDKLKLYKRILEEQS